LIRAAGHLVVQITAPREALPGFFLIATQSDKPGTREMNEISLLVRTATGGVVVVGCSHPGIEKILDAVIKIEPRIYSVLGGFHLVDASDAEVTEMIMRFRDSGGSSGWRPAIALASSPLPRWRASTGRVSITPVWAR
jgi:metal-dependent hydrolase (beta-lactamase superfamily II)